MGTEARAQPFWGWGDFRASTPAEGYARGMADVVRSLGMYNLNTAQAAGELEAARSTAIENNLRSTEAYFEMRRMNQEYRDSQRRTPSASDIARVVATWQPHRLSSSDFDSVTGQLAWPTILREDEFADDRATVDAVFGRMAEAQGAVTSADRHTVNAAIEALRQKLLARIRDYPSSVYMESRRFLDGLEEELRG